MRKKYLFLPKFSTALAAGAFVLTVLAGCGANKTTSETPTAVPSDAATPATTNQSTPLSDSGKEDPGNVSSGFNEPTYVAPVSFPQREDSDFSMQSDTGSGFTYNEETNTYSITAAGSYDCTGKLYEGQILINAGEEDLVELNLSECEITSTEVSPIYILCADSVEISAKKETENLIADYRSFENDKDSEEGSAAIYAKCDLTLKGTGKLTVTSLANNGIHTKKDLTLQKLTLSVNAMKNGIKGNDSIEMKSGTVTVVAKDGDGLKTTETDLNKNGEQRGSIVIQTGALSIYSAKDAIDAAADVTVSEDSSLSLFTGTYAEKQTADSGKTRFYLDLSSELNSLGYRYAAYLTRADGTGYFTDLSLTYSPAQSSSMQGGGFGGFGGGNRPGSFDGQADTDRFGGRKQNNRNETVTPPDGSDFPQNPFSEGFIGEFTPPTDGSGTETIPGNSEFGKWNKGGGFDGMFSSNANYTYSALLPSDITSLQIYAFPADTVENEKASFTAATEVFTLPAKGNTLTPSGISGQTIVVSDFTTFSASVGQDIAYSCKGINAGNQVTLSGGSTVIQASDDGVHAGFDTVLASTGQNGKGIVTVTGGSLTVTSGDDGLHADQDLFIEGGSVTVLASYEGLEGNRIYLKGGFLTINASDDAVNANSKGAYTAVVEVSGGEIDATVGSGDTDTIDSNGTIVISGGTVIVKNGQRGVNMSGGAIDAERSLSVNGGTVVSLGGTGDTISGAFTNMNYSLPAGNYALTDAKGTTLLSFTTKSAYTGYMIQSDRFTSGETYYLKNTSTNENLLTFTK